MKNDQLPLAYLKTPPLVLGQLTYGQPQISWYLGLESFQHKW